MSTQSQELRQLLDLPSMSDNNKKDKKSFSMDFDTIHGGQVETGPLTKKQIEDMGGDPSIQPEKDHAFHRAILQEVGLDPNEVEIVGSVRVSKWQQVQDGDWLTAYKLQLAPKSETAQFYTNPVNVMDYFKDITIDTLSKSEPSSGKFFVWHIGDLHIGKADGGGTDHAVRIFLTRLSQALREYQKLSKIENLEGVQIAFVGDGIEGVVSQGGKNTGGKSMDLSLTEQIRIVQQLIAQAVTEFAKIAPKVYLDTVNGNHDESMRSPVSTSPGDGWATSVAHSIETSMKMFGNGQFDHVQVRTPSDDRGFMTIPVGSSTVIMVHGHQWSGGQKGSMNWWNQMASHGQVPIEGVMQFGHFHSPYLSTDQQKTVICCDTFEDESGWFLHKGGSSSRNAGITYILSDNSISYYTQHTGGEEHDS